MAHSPEFIQELTEAQDLFVWEAPAWEWNQRGPKWYLWMGLVALGLVAYAIFTANYLFAFLILLFAIIIVLAGNEPAHAALIQIGHNGIVFRGRLYLFHEISDFAIVYHPPQTKVLYIQPKRAYRPRLRIELDEQDPVAIREHLRRYVDEDLALREEHLSDIVGRLLRL